MRKSHEKYGRESKGAPQSKPETAQDMTKRQHHFQWPFPEVKDPFMA